MPALRRYRMYAPAIAWFERRRREFQSLRSKIGRRLPALAGATSRTDPRGGVLIAFMGPDGAGKSTLVHETTSWLRWKLDARIVYFGSGDGPSSLARWPLKLVLRAGRSLGLWKPGRRASGETPGTPRRDKGGPGFARALWALLLSLEKRQTLRRAWRARERGIIVVCDRYPQQQIMGFNDGPLLDPWTRSASGVLRALARWESVPYRRAEERPPQLVIKLQVSPRVAVERKPEMRPEEIERRLAALASLRYPAGTRVADVDANRRPEAVLLDCKAGIWETL
jgi:thymidylate kinase